MVIVHISPNQRRIISPEKNETIRELFKRFCLEFGYSDAEYQFQTYPEDDLVSLDLNIKADRVKEVQLVKKTDFRRESQDSNLDPPSVSVKTEHEIVVPVVPPTANMPVSKSRPPKRSAPKPPAPAINSSDVSDESLLLDIEIPPPPDFLPDDAENKNSYFNSVECETDSFNQDIDSSSSDSIRQTPDSENHLSEMENRQDDIKSNVVENMESCCNNLESEIKEKSRSCSSVEDVYDEEDLLQDCSVKVDRSQNVTKKVTDIDAYIKNSNIEDTKDPKNDVSASVVMPVNHNIDRRDLFDDKVFISNKKEESLESKVATSDQNKISSIQPVIEHEPRDSLNENMKRENIKESGLVSSPDNYIPDDIESSMKSNEKSVEMVEKSQVKDESSVNFGRNKIEVEDNKPLDKDHYVESPQDICPVVLKQEKSEDLTTETDEPNEILKVEKCDDSYDEFDSRPKSTSSTNEINVPNNDLSTPDGSVQTSVLSPTQKQYWDPPKQSKTLQFLSRSLNTESFTEVPTTEVKSEINKAPVVPPKPAKSVKLVVEERPVEDSGRPVYRPRQGKTLIFTSNK